MRQVTINRKSVSPQQGLTSYTLDISVVSTVDMPREIFVMQRVKKYDGTYTDTFVAVCSPTQLEDLEVRSPAADSSYFRVSSFQLVSSALEFLNYAYAEIVADIQTLCADMDANDVLADQSTVTIDGGTTVIQPIEVSYRLSGVISLAMGINEGTVTGLNLPFTPTSVMLTMQKPADGDNIFPILVQNSVTTNGFTFELSATTSSAEYKLNYLILQ